MARHELVKLFTTLIGNVVHLRGLWYSPRLTTALGDVSNCTEYKDEQKRRVFDLAFTNTDASK